MVHLQRAPRQLGSRLYHLVSSYPKLCFSQHPNSSFLEPLERPTPQDLSFIGLGIDCILNRRVNNTYMLELIFDFL